MYTLARYHKNLGILRKDDQVIAYTKEHSEQLLAPGAYLLMPFDRPTERMIDIWTTSMWFEKAMLIQSEKGEQYSYVHINPLEDGIFPIQIAQWADALNNDIRCTEKFFKHFYTTHIEWFKEFTVLDFYND